MVYIFLAPGFEEAEALVPADLLRRAGIETALVSLGGRVITGGHNIGVQADLPITDVDLDKAQMLVLPGGTVGVQNLGESESLKELLTEASARNIPLAAICAAPTLLGKWGLLQGRNFVCYPGLETGVTDGIAHPDQSTVDDGLLTTGRAAGSSFDFGLRLIARLAGEEKAAQIAAGIHYHKS